MRAGTLSILFPAGSQRREQSMARSGGLTQDLPKMKQAVHRPRGVVTCYPGTAPLPVREAPPSPPPLANFHCSEKTSAAQRGAHPGLRPHLSAPRGSRVLNAPIPRPARHTSRAFSWPTSPDAACLARPLSSSPSPFTWLWEAMRCVFVVLFTSSIFILQTSGIKT